MHDILGTLIFGPARLEHRTNARFSRGIIGLMELSETYTTQFLYIHRIESPLVHF